MRSGTVLACDNVSYNNKEMHVLYCINRCKSVLINAAIREIIVSFYVLKCRFNEIKVYCLRKPMLTIMICGKHCTSPSGFLELVACLIV